MHFGMQPLLHLFHSYVSNLERSESIIKPVELQGGIDIREPTTKTKFKLSSSRVKLEIVFANRIIVDIAMRLVDSFFLFHVVTQRDRRSQIELRGTIPVAAKRE